MVHRGGPAVCSLASLGGLRFYRSRQVDQVLAFFTGAFGLCCVRLAVDENKSLPFMRKDPYKSPFREKDLRWDEITETRYGQQPINAGAHFGLIGWLIAAMARATNKMIRSLELIGPHKIVLNSNIRDVEELVRLVLAAVNPRLRKDAERISTPAERFLSEISLSPPA